MKTDHDEEDDEVTILKKEVQKLKCYIALLRATKGLAHCGYHYFLMPERIDYAWKLLGYGEQPINDLPDVVQVIDLSAAIGLEEDHDYSIPGMWD